MSETASREMPRYACHKEVHALKIHSLIPNSDGTTTMLPHDEGYGPLDLSQEYMSKHSPRVGGYYVVYKDGYESFSPADAFEDGYTLIGGK